MTKFYKLESVLVDDHENHHLSVSSTDIEWQTVNGEFALNVLLCVSDKLYVGIVREGSVFVSEPLLYTQIVNIYILGDETSQRMLENMLTINNMSMGLLYNELHKPEFKANYPWAKEIDYVSDTEIKVLCSIAKDSDRRELKEFKLTIVKDFNFDSIQNIKVYVSLPCFDLFTLSDDLEGYVQDLNLIKVGIHQLFTFVVSDYLYNLGIESSQQLSKLQDIELGAVSVVLNKEIGEQTNG